MLLRACDIDKVIPAKRYTITADDGRTVSKDLCEEHAEPFEEWLEEAELPEEEVEQAYEEPEVEPEPEPAPVVPKRPAVKKVAAKKAPAKKAAPAKKTTSRRRPKITSLEEIERSKQQG
ncbi:hypothetical protein KGG90_gp57 [Streptomyces phage Thestral]|uniref:DNA binding protein n=1 Tax=Streptomyces phage Thestral TaxID=2301715 RepID=A0A385E0G1_9CAUD|nr:hypothetical protein KGG90_gp57 [Streptomyces phage Thestral]AXQ65226.1 DNA binding protein [Streptomyces phage Thestral]